MNHGFLEKLSKLKIKKHQQHFPERELHGKITEYVDKIINIKTYSSKITAL